MRVNEAAKKYNLSDEDLITLLKRAGFDVGQDMSFLSFDMVTTLEKFTRPRKSKVKAKKKAAKKTTTKAAKVKVKVKVKVVAKAKAQVVKKATVDAKVKKVILKPKVVASKPAAKPKTVSAKPAAKPKVVASKPVAKPKTVTAKPVAKPKAAAKPAATRKATAKPVASARAKVSPTPTIEAPPPKPAPVSLATSKPGKPPVAKARAAVEAPVKEPKPRARGSVAQQKAVRESVRRTLAKIETTRRTKRRKTKSRKETSSVAAAVKIHEAATLRELAEAFKLEPTALVKICLDLGIESTIDQTLDRELVELLAEDLGVDIQFASDEVESLLEAAAPVDPARLESRAPIVTVMGHVDHGKTSVLDYIRDTRVASGEAGGITQHIGAYEVETGGTRITFIDTPGHEAFTSMRARGAQVTDIVVLVVAADDGVMPQTIEAINHARAAGVPIIVAINKIDLAAADPKRIRQQLTEHDVVVEDFGGDVIVAEVSAKKGTGIDKLLEMILLQAELLELKADPGASARAVAVEVRKEEGRGILCTVLVTQGTLRVGDTFVIGAQYGKIRALLDHRGRTIHEAPPAMPVVILGCNGLPEAGDRLTAVRGEREARDIATRRQQLQKDRDHRTTKKVTLEDLYDQIQDGDLKELRLIIKCDTNGSVEALTESLTQLALDEVGIKVIHAGVGIVGESDVLLASSSQALVVGFNVKVSAKAQEVAEREKVEIKTYNVIYEAITEVDDAMKGLLDPVRVERTLGKAEVRKVYKISHLGQIAGSMVTEGLIARNAQVRVLREDEVVHEGKISSLKRFQDDVKEVQKDFECGIGVSSFNELQEGDVLEAFVVEEKARVF